MNFAVIGAAHGHIYEFIEDMLETGGEFKGIYNDSSQNVHSIAEKYNVAVYECMEELFQTGIQVVGTSAVNNHKIDIIEACSNHGVHVIADKPIVIDESQYNRLERVIQKGNIEVGLMLTVRFMPAAYTVKKLIDNKKIGKLLSVEIFSPHRLRRAERPDWHFERDKNGGIIIDLIIHSVDFYNWLTNSPIIEASGTVTKSILKEKENFYDCSQFFVNSQNGVNGYLRVDWHMSDTHWCWGDLRIFCTGTKGMIEARVTGDPVTREAVVVLFEEGKETVKMQLQKPDSSVTKDFLNRINKKEYVIGHSDILEASRLAVEFDKKAKIINMSEYTKEIV